MTFDMLDKIEAIPTTKTSEYEQILSIVCGSCCYLLYAKFANVSHDFHFIPRSAKQKHLGIKQQKTCT